VMQVSQFGEVGVRRVPFDDDDFPTRVPLSQLTHVQHRESPSVCEQVPLSR